MSLLPRLWYYRRDDGTLAIPFDASDSLAIDKGLLSPDLPVLLREGAFYGSHGGYFVNLQTMTLETPAGRVGSVTLQSFSQDYNWEWRTHRGFQSYDAVAVDLLEAAYRAALVNQRWDSPVETTVFLTHEHFGREGGYHVDLKRARQVNPRTAFSRAVRRVPPLAPIHCTLPPPPPIAALPQLLSSAVVSTFTSSTSPLSSSPSSPPLISSSSPQLPDTSQFTFVPLPTSNSLFVPDSPLVPECTPQGNHHPSPLHPASQPQRQPQPQPQLQPQPQQSQWQPQGPMTSHDEKLRLCAQVTQWQSHVIEPDDSCAICLCDYDAGSDPIELPCGHHYCKDCILHCFKGFLTCPICNRIYGVRTGPQPPGTMTVTHTNQICAGEAPGTRTICIRFHFPSGTQDELHPEPGLPYRGTSRTAYLPDSMEGRKILKLFQTAWERRLLFRVGTSVTSGAANSVVWNGIHMKTATHGGATAYGYPDATYFARVRAELHDKGVVGKTATKSQ
eukprot:TRINITY_DN12555_c0_g1_i1.p1 TRINITY_DN12555_c0_g1~~TRINITY_DN12555_c0_g1_i1.p1  ORF type:complete len:503 (+),score=19.89 TRINITY_DN12555_c0_g1_i1:22-1530(+)